MSIPIVASGGAEDRECRGNRSYHLVPTMIGFTMVPENLAGPSWIAARSWCVQLLFCMGKTSMQFSPKNAIVSPKQTVSLRTKDRHPLLLALGLRVFWGVCVYLTFWPRFLHAYNEVVDRAGFIVVKNVMTMS